jgi:hypothetical protein
MRELDGDLIEITHEIHDRIFAKVTAEGRALTNSSQSRLGHCGGPLCRN